MPGKLDLFDDFCDDFEALLYQVGSFHGWKLFECIHVRNLLFHCPLKLQARADESVLDEHQIPCMDCYRIDINYQARHALYFLNR